MQGERGATGYAIHRGAHTRVSYTSTTTTTFFYSIVVTGVLIKVLVCVYTERWLSDRGRCFYIAVFVVFTEQSLADILKRFSETVATLSSSAR